MPSSGLPLSLLSVGALALASQLPAGSFAFGHEGHWGSAGAGILLVAGTGHARKVLVLLRSEDVTEPGLWNLAGGAVDRDEDPLDAGLRELREETGLGFAPSVAHAHLLGQTVWHSPNGRFRYTTSVVEVPVSVMKHPIELNWENDEHKWVGEAWLRENEEELHPGFRAKMDELIAIAFGSAAAGDPPRELAGSAARAGRRRSPGSRARAKTTAKPREPMMLCPRCSGSERAWVGTPNPDSRSQDREERDSSRPFVHPGTHSGWAGCPVCTHGHVPESVHDTLVGKASGSRAYVSVRTYTAAGPRDPVTLEYARERLSVCKAHDPLLLKKKHLYHSTAGHAFTAAAPGALGTWHSGTCDVCAGVHVQGVSKGSRGMSGETSLVVVVSTTPHRVGFAGHAVVRNLSRGKPHDPRAIHHVEVILGSDDPALLRDDRKVHRAAQQAAAGHGISPGHARIASGVYPANGQAGPKYRVRVDVE